jgi:uncharacterized protein (TIGR03435 family)
VQGHPNVPFYKYNAVRYRQWRLENLVLKPLAPTMQKLIVALLLATSYRGRPQNATLTFTTVTLKASVNSERGSQDHPGTIRLQPDGHWIAEKALFGLLVQTAYGMQPFQVSGGPDWPERWDVEGVAPPGTTHAQIRLMLQTLLQDRFKLKVHRETRDTHVYELRLAATGLKAPQPTRGCRPPGTLPPPPPAPPEPGKSLDPPQAVCGSIVLNLNSLTEAQLVGGQVSVMQLIGVLSSALGGAVIDKTSIQSKIDVNVAFTPDAALAGIPMPTGHPLPAVGGGSIFSAIEQQMGLKLEPAKSVEILIIDHAEKPQD